MAHVRQQIRDAVTATLTGLATTGANISENRIYTIPQSALPFLNVTTESEDSESNAMGMGSARQLLRKLELVVIGYARAVADVPDTLDTIAAEVETQLNADTTLGGLALDLWLDRTDFDFAGEGDNPTASITLTFVVMYRTATNAPEVST